MNPASFWQEQYRIVPSQLQLLPKIHSVVTAFNTNIDAVIKLKGSQIAELAAAVNIDNASASLPSRISTPQDVVRGIIRCFTLGIAEEWLAEDAQIVTWMMQNLGYDRLQMGGQSGIISNVMALLGVNKVYVHTNSHPALQSQQFLDMDNLLAIDENGSWQKASAVSRNDDPLIHWIIEFDKATQKFENEKRTFEYDVKIFMRDKGIPIKIAFFGSTFGLDIDSDVSNWRDIPRKIPINVLYDQ